jgi:hypothetical protein
MQKTKPVAKKRQVTDFKKIARQMAQYFEKHISAADLISWTATISVDINTNLKENEGAADFIGNLGWWFLPQLIKCTTPAERIIYLEEGAPDIFRSAGYSGTKEALATIGSGWLASNAQQKGSLESVSSFMRILTTFLCLAEMYSEYEYYINKECEEDNAVAVAEAEELLTRIGKSQLQTSNSKL